MALSQAAIQNAMDRAQRVRAQFAAFKAKGEKEVGRMVQTVEVAGTACALGLVAGRYGKDGSLEVAGIPFDLLVGFGALAAGIYCSQNDEDDYAQHLQAIGDGALALYLGRYGTQHGMQWKARAENKTSSATASTVKPAGTTTAGLDYPAFGAAYYPAALPAPRPSPLTPEEMAAMVHGVR